ncbi:unnamed protein product [Fraxinus pennsylvanica]|uniref:Uncharacterized protein n=1 Tax=Fraxinus pennsylvanica TaxID=56036 RepID=A0AAD1YNI2_9LAMI|nr:unnamed protein product [Fraxinus pennsylvanica]
MSSCQISLRYRYNLKKSKRVKAFHCREYDSCIEKAKLFASVSSKKTGKYAHRDDAIVHALELEGQGNKQSRSFRTPNDLKDVRMRIAGRIVEIVLDGCLVPWKRAGKALKIVGNFRRILMITDVNIMKIGSSFWSHVLGKAGCRRIPWTRVEGGHTELKGLFLESFDEWEFVGHHWLMTDTMARLDKDLPDLVAALSKVTVSRTVATCSELAATSNEIIAARTAVTRLPLCGKNSSVV